MRELAERIAAARRLTIVTGAGVSAASGVPTFRGAQGLWQSFRAEDLATPDAFARDPRLVWEWYDWRRTRIAACRPNAAHDIIADWSHREGFTRSPGLPTTFYLHVAVELTGVPSVPSGFCG